MRISDWSSDVCSSDLVLREWSAHGSIASTVDWLTALRRYLVAITVGNLVWEFAHLPLYTIWYEGTPGEILFAVLHCTGGDLLIASAERAEESRVGQESVGACIAWWSAVHKDKKEVYNKRSRYDSKE